MAVAHWEVHGFPKWKWIEGDFHGTRKVRVAWANAMSLILEIDASPSWPYTSTGPSSALAREVTCEPLPARITPDGGNSALATYEWALLTIRYSTVGPQISGSILVEEEYRPSSMGHLVKRSNLFWADGTPLDTEDAFSREVFTMDYIVRFHQLTAIPSWIYSRIGTVNAGDVTSYHLGKTFGAETLRFIPPHLTITSGFALLTRYNLTLTYQHNPFGWNTAWRNDGGVGGQGGYENVYLSDGTRALSYPLVSYA